VVNLELRQTADNSKAGGWNTSMPLEEPLSAATFEAGVKSISVLFQILPNARLAEVTSVRLELRQSADNFEAGGRS